MAAGAGGGEPWGARAAHVQQDLRPPPAASRWSCSKTPCKQRVKHAPLRGHLSWEGSPDASCSTPEVSRQMSNNRFSSPPCGANMEKQVKSGLQLQIRRLRIMPAFHATSSLSKPPELTHRCGQFSHNNILQRVPVQMHVMLPATGNTTLLTGCRISLWNKSY